MPNNLRDKVLHASPATLDERAELADLCMTRLSIELPAVLDDFEDTTDTNYTGWPERLYLIDRDGHVAYKSRPGPFGFKPADLETALESIAPA